MQTSSARASAAGKSERQPLGAVRGDQAGEPVAAGHQHEAAGAAGDQRAYLVGAGRIVQHDEDPLAGEHAAVLARRLVHIGRHPLGWHAAERAQERRERLGR